MVPLVKPTDEFSVHDMNRDGDEDLTSSIKPEEDCLLLLAPCRLGPDIQLQAVLADRLAEHLSGIDELGGCWAHNVDFAIGDGGLRNIGWTVTGTWLSVPMEEQRRKAIEERISLLALGWGQCSLTRTARDCG